MNERLADHGLEFLLASNGRIHHLERVWLDSTTHMTCSLDAVDSSGVAQATITGIGPTGTQEDPAYSRMRRR